MLMAILMMSMLEYLVERSKILNVNSKAFDLTEEVAYEELRTKLQKIRII